MPDAEKLGLKLVYQWATKELGGKIELVPSPGAKFRITFETQDPLKRGDDRDFADAEDSRR
ncbi:MAG: hypothetical protein NTY19_17965 [Planctomycetota bacterium]|nr:hypothetical protein [Planctomycetota bacterium]